MKQVTQRISSLGNVRAVNVLALLATASLLVAAPCDDAVPFERSGRPQVVELPDGETSVEVQASRTSGTGRIELDLRSFRSSARAAGRVTDKAVIVKDGKREKREINEDFEIRVDATSRAVGASGE